MSKRSTCIGVALVLAWALPAWGQKATEVFIPIGESPGVSGRTSVVGTIVSVNDTTRTITIRNEDGESVARMTDRTKLWMDNSHLKKPNHVATMADCQPGRLCEIKYAYRDTTRTDEADWIKIRAPVED